MNVECEIRPCRGLSLYGVTHRLTPAYPVPQIGSLADAACAALSDAITGVNGGRVFYAPSTGGANASLFSGIAGSSSTGTGTGSGIVVLVVQAPAAALAQALAMTLTLATRALTLTLALTLALTQAMTLTLALTRALTQALA